MSATIKDYMVSLRILSFAAGCLLMPALGSANVTTAASLRERASSLIGSVPLRFEVNRGQFDPQVRFYSRFSEQQVFLTDREAVLRVDQRVLRIRPRGANRQPAVQGQNALPAQSSYFLGADRSKWRTGVPNFAAVEYRQAYPGIDLIYKGNSRQLEYDFVLGPGADPRKIQLEFAGADRVAIDASGALVITLGKTVLRQPKPLVFQPEPSGAPKLVAGSYRLLGGNQVGFQLAAYDRTKPLTIDPVVVQTTYLGGSNTNYVHAAAVDTQGFVWVTGYTTSADFPPAGDVLAAESAGYVDSFIARFHPTMTGPYSLVHSTYLGGSGDDTGTAIAVDPYGGVVVAGTTTSTNFPTSNAYKTANAGDRDAFVVLLNYSQGGGVASLWYSTYLGGTKADFATAVAVDRNALIYVVGYTASDDIPMLGDPLQPATRGGWEAFLVQLNPYGNTTSTGLYSTYLGGESTDVAEGVAVDSSGKVYVAGSTLSVDFPISDTPFQPVYQGTGDAFLMRLDISKPGLWSLDYSTFFGGSDYDKVFALALDPAGRVFVAGYTLSSDLPLTANTVQWRKAGSSDVFVAGFDLSKPPAQALVYSTYLGGQATEVAYGMAVDSAGRIVVTGYTTSSDFPVKGDGVQQVPGGVFDAFVTWLDPRQVGFDSILCSTYFGGNGNDIAYAVVPSGLGEVFIGGSSSSSSLPATANSYQPNRIGFVDGFVSKLSYCGPRSVPNPTVSSPGMDEQ